MAADLTTDDVLRVARLARLALTPDDVDAYRQQLSAILEYAAEVQRIDTTGVPATSQPFQTGDRWRDDVTVPSIDRTTVLDAAPGAAPRAGLFRVPKVL